MATATVTATPLPLLLLPPLASSSSSSRRSNGSPLRSTSLRFPQKCRLERSPIRAASEEITQSPVPMEKVQQAASAAVASDDGIVNTVVAALLSIAFVGLVILTIGVIYLGVEDFLTKRNREKFEKEEAERKKKEKKTGKKSRVLRGPRSIVLKDLDDD